MRVPYVGLLSNLPLALRGIHFAKGVVYGAKIVRYPLLIFIAPARFDIGDIRLLIIAAGIGPGPFCYVQKSTHL